MATWSEFEASDPRLAEEGHRLIYQFGVGLGYLATIRRDGGPRVHPMCPIVSGGRLWALIAHSPKQQDLLRDGRYALHSFASPETDDEFYVTGSVRPVNDPEVRKLVLETYLATGATSSGDEQLFELRIERALLATYKKRGEGGKWP